MLNTNEYVAASALALAFAVSGDAQCAVTPNADVNPPFSSSSAASSAIGVSTGIVSVSSTLTYVDRLLIEYSSVVAVLARTFPRAIISADYLTDPEYGDEISVLTVSVPSATVDELIEWESNFYKTVSKDPHLLSLSQKVTVAIA